MLGRFRSRKTPSSASLLHRIYTMFKRRGPDLANHPNEWNIPLPPDVIYHIIDTYLATSTTMALCAAFPVLWSYCHPHTYQHMILCIHGDWLPEKFFITIELFQCPPALGNSLSLSTQYDFGYARKDKARGVLSVVSDLTHDLTSIKLDITVRWDKLDKYVKAYVLALLQRSGLRSVTLESCDIPVNRLGVVRNLQTLDVDTSLGRPDKFSLSGMRGRVYVEEVCLRYGFQYCLIGPRTPFNWSRLRTITYSRCRGGPQGLLKLCSSSLQVLELDIEGEREYIDLDLGILTDLRQITLSIKLSHVSEHTMDSEFGPYFKFSAMPFKWVPYTLASCNKRNTVEKIVLILSTFGRLGLEELRQCDWLSVDKIFEGEGTWMSLKEVLVVNCDVRDDQLEYIEAIPTPSLQARGVIKWHVR